MRLKLLGFVIPLMILAACSGSPGNGQDLQVDRDSSTQSDSGITWPVWEDGECTFTGEEIPDYVHEITCLADFMALSSRPWSSEVPGAFAVKTIIDTADNDTLYFVNANEFELHYTFAAAYLSGNGLPPVPDRTTFSSIEYYKPERRFYLATLVYYESPGVWAWEFGPYDTATSEMIEKGYHIVAKALPWGAALLFHPTSTSLEARAADLDIPQVRTIDLLGDAAFLPMNPGVSMGRLTFVRTSDLVAGRTFVTPEQIPVLDQIPPDITVVAGIVTEELQTPLSHVNVLSRNRGTPNMSLPGARELLASLEGKWVRMEVGIFDYSFEEVTSAEAREWLDEHRSDPVNIPAADKVTMGVRDVRGLTLEQVGAYGAKACNFGILSLIEGVPVPKGLAVPMAWYWKFMDENGFTERVEELLQDDDFIDKIEVRDHELARLRQDMLAAALDPELVSFLEDLLREQFPGQRVRFRSSTNAEDLDGFTGAGLYTSESADPDDPSRPVEIALKTVWASIWGLRAFEERSWRSIDHLGVGMAILIHRTFVGELANGVAITGNVFDYEQPAYYVNTQKGDVSVVNPPEGVVAEQYLHFFLYPGHEINYLSHSNLVEPGETVLTADQAQNLGQVLYRIHKGFAAYYKHEGRAYAMDVEFKLDGGNPGTLWIKQARPFTGWPAAEETGEQ